MARRGITIGPGAGVLMGVGFAIGLIVVIVVAQFFGLAMWQPSGGETPQAPPQTGYSLPLPVKITVRDAITGSVVTSGTVYVLDGSGRVLETLAVDSNGQAVTAMAYTSGEKLTLFYVGTGYGGAALEYEVPLAASEAQDYYYAAVDVYHFPDDAGLSLSVMDKLGTQVATETSGGSTTFTEGKAELSLHLVLSESYGLVSYYDPIEKEDDDVLVVFELNDTLPTLQADGLSLERIEYGGKVYYVAKLSDIISTIEEPAIEDISFTMYYSGSNTISLTVKVLTHTDLDVFKSSLAVDSDGFEDATAALVLTAS